MQCADPKGPLEACGPNRDSNARLLKAQIKSSPANLRPERCFRVQIRNLWPLQGEAAPFSEARQLKG